MIEVRDIIAGDGDEIFEQLEILVVKMYDDMSEQGLNINISKDGAKILCESIRKTAGRNNYLVGTFDNNKMTGFGIATLRVTPSYLGNLRVGAISHIYILPNERRDGKAKMLLDKMEKWLIGKDVHSIELEVLYHNQVGIDFWKKNNYKPELLKMRKSG